MREEYTSLRDELLQWQEYRFLVLGFMMALVGAMLGFELREIQQYWFVISAVGLLLLAIAGFVSWYAGDGNMKIAAYIFVFYEQPTSITDGHPGWERRLRLYDDLRQKKELDAPEKNPTVSPQKTKSWGIAMNLNRWIATAYLFLGVAVAAVPWVTAEYAAEHSSLHPLPTLQVELLWAGFVMFLMALLALCLSNPKERYIRQWERVRRHETEETTPGNR